MKADLQECIVIHVRTKNNSDQPVLFRLNPFLRSYSMNKSLAKHIIVITVIAFAAIPLFAKPAVRDRVRDRDVQGQCSNFYDMTGRNEGYHRGMRRAAKMGYVASADKGSVVITDADGKNVQIHINPLTKIIKQSPDALQCPERRINREAPDFGSIEDITKGSWILVTSFDTGTTEIEARCIVIPLVPEK
jgi:hypothetical protein